MRGIPALVRPHIYTETITRALGPDEGPQCWKICGPWSASYKVKLFSWQTKQDIFYVGLLHRKRVLCNFHPFLETIFICGYFVLINKQQSFYRKSATMIYILRLQVTSRIYCDNPCLSWQIRVKQEIVFKILAVMYGDSSVDIFLSTHCPPRDPR